MSSRQNTLKQIFGQNRLFYYNANSTYLRESKDGEFLQNELIEAFNKPISSNLQILTLASKETSELLSNLRKQESNRLLKIRLCYEFMKSVNLNQSLFSDSGLLKSCSAVSLDHLLSMLCRELSSAIDKSQYAYRKDYIIQLLKRYCDICDYYNMSDDVKRNKLSDFNGTCFQQEPSTRCDIKRIAKKLNKLLASGDVPSKSHKTKSHDRAPLYMFRLTQVLNGAFGDGFMSECYLTSLLDMFSENCELQKLSSDGSVKRHAQVDDNKSLRIKGAMDLFSHASTGYSSSIYSAKPILNPLFNLQGLQNCLDDVTVSARTTVLSDSDGSLTSFSKNNPKRSKLDVITQLTLPVWKNAREYDYSGINRVHDFGFVLRRYLSDGRCIELQLFNQPTTVRKFSVIISKKGGESVVNRVDPYVVLRSTVEYTRQLFVPKCLAHDVSARYCVKLLLARFLEMVLLCRNNYGVPSDSLVRLSKLCDQLLDSQAYLSPFQVIPHIQNVYLLELAEQHVSLLIQKLRESLQVNTRVLDSELSDEYCLSLVFSNSDKSVAYFVKALESVLAMTLSIEDSMRSMIELFSSWFDITGLQLPQSSSITFIASSAYRFLVEMEYALLTFVKTFKIKMNDYCMYKERQARSMKLIK